MRVLVTWETGGSTMPIDLQGGKNSEIKKQILTKLKKFNNLQLNVIMALHFNWFIKIKNQWNLLFFCNSPLAELYACLLSVLVFVRSSNYLLIFYHYLKFLSKLSSFKSFFQFFITIQTAVCCLFFLFFKYSICTKNHQTKQKKTK